MSTQERRILVIDDDPCYRALLQDFLTRHGMFVVARSGGGRIVETVIRERIDLVLLDLMLAGEDGLVLCPRLRAGAVNVPVIMVTAKEETVDRIVSHPHQPLSRARLGTLARQGESSGRHSMDSHIARLRRLIEDDTANPCYIRTIRGFGCVFSPEGRGS